MRRLVATAVALFALLAASCVDDDGPMPSEEDATPSPTPTATEAVDRVATATPAPTSTATPTPAPAPPATATPAATGSSAPPATATPTTTPTPSPTPTPTATAVPTPEPPPVTVQGPLLVVSERLGDAPPRDGGDEIEMRRVFIYDVAEDRYWAAFDYENPRSNIGLGSEANRSAVQPAGTSIIVWSGDQVRRMGLDGETQAVLFEDDTIRAIRVSPDGAKVAVMHGEPGTLLVLDARDGAEVLRVASDDPDLGTLYGGGRFEMLALGDWRDDSAAVSVTAGDYSGPQAHTAVLWLDGNIRVLAEGLIASPNLRYAIRTGERIDTRMHDDVWDSLAVLDVDTGRVVWTIKGRFPDNDGLIGVQRADVWATFSPAWDQLDDSRLWLGSYAAFSDRGGWVLDTETGETLPLTPDIERRIEGPVRSTCGIDDGYPQHGPYACYVQHEERVTWEGAVGWTRYLGLIEVPGGLELRGIEPVAVVREAPSPDRDEIVGPLLAYEVHGEYEYRLGDGRPDARGTRRVIVHDEGTGRSWLVFTYQNWFAHAYVGRGAAQPARGGFVAEIGGVITYLAVNGQSTALSRRWAEQFHVSPDGRTLATRLYGGNDGTAYFSPEIVLRDLASGEEIVRYVDDELPAALGLSSESEYWGVDTDGWTSDSGAILLRLRELSVTDGHDDVGDVYYVLVDLGGEVSLAAMDRATYFERLARFHPPSRATTECPPHPAQACRILLDGEVIGEGRWPRIIGFIELD